METNQKMLYILIALIIIGLMAVFSASLPMCFAKHLNPFYYFGQHVLWLILGYAGFHFFAGFDYKRLRPYAIHFAVLVILLLLLVKFTPLGVTINGATRWLNLGFFRFQPSELTKIATIMLLASLFSVKKVDVKSVMYYVGTLLIMVFCILKQPNLSMTLILIGISFCMYVFSGKTLKYISIGLAILVLSVGILKTNISNASNLIESYQWGRIVHWLDSNSDVQGEGYQVYHSMIAISTGGIFGQGYGASKEKLGWLPEAHTDFIFSVIAEEMGFTTCAFIIFLFLALLYSGMRVAYSCPDVYGKLLASGITISIVMQAFINIAVATAFFPATGVTLPFISYGGSSLLVSLSMMGVLFNISKHNTLMKIKKHRIRTEIII